MDLALQKTIKMSIIFLFLLVAQTTSMPPEFTTAVSTEVDDFEYPPELKDDNTDYELLCSNVSVQVNFSNLAISRLGKYFISSPLIECLDLTHIGISDLEIYAFNNLPKLKYLQISNNGFTLNNIFHNNFKELEVLVLDDVGSRCEDLWCRMQINGVYPKLRKLFLRSTNIFSSEDVRNHTFPSLTHLSLSNSQVQTDDFGQLPESLEYLDLSGHRLSSLSLRNLRNLKQLFLNPPYEKSLSGLTLENLDNLKYLSAPSNALNRIYSSSLKNIKSLLYLDLSDNNIEVVEERAFDSLPNLRFLNLSKNGIERINDGFFDKIYNLQTLILEKNKIEMIPKIYSEIGLKSFMLNCNKIKNIVGGTFKMVPQLELLFLHDNEISYVDQQAFAGLVNLKVLTLTNNQISILHSNWMIPMKSLEDLDLSGNNFRDFDNLSLSQNSGLKNLYLSKQFQLIHAYSLLNVPENMTISFDESFTFVEKCLKAENNRNRYYG